MIKKTYIKRMYKESVFCDKCGTQMKKTGICYCTYPPDFEYICSNCGYQQYYKVDTDQIKFEYEEENNEL